MAKKGVIIINNSKQYPFDDISKIQISDLKKFVKNAFGLKLVDINDIDLFDRNLQKKIYSYSDLEKIKEENAKYNLIVIRIQYKPRGQQSLLKTQIISNDQIRKIYNEKNMNANINDNNSNMRNSNKYKNNIRINNNFSNNASNTSNKRVNINITHNKNINNNISSTSNNNINTNINNTSNKNINRNISNPDNKNIDTNINNSSNKSINTNKTNTNIQNSNAYMSQTSNSSINNNLSSSNNNINDSNNRININKGINKFINKNSNKIDNESNKSLNKESNKDKNNTSNISNNSSNINITDSSKENSNTNSTKKMKKKLDINLRSKPVKILEKNKISMKNIAGDINDEQKTKEELEKYKKEREEEIEKLEKELSELKKINENIIKEGENYKDEDDDIILDDKMIESIKKEIINEVKTKIEDEFKNKIDNKIIELNEENIKEYEKYIENEFKKIKKENVEKIDKEVEGINLKIKEIKTKFNERKNNYNNLKNIDNNIDNNNNIYGNNNNRIERNRAFKREKGSNNNNINIISNKISNPNNNNINNNNFEDDQENIEDEDFKINLPKSKQIYFNKQNANPDLKKTVHNESKLSDHLKKDEAKKVNDNLRKTQYNNEPPVQRKKSQEINLLNLLTIIFFKDPQMTQINTKNIDQRYLEMIQNAYFKHIKEPKNIVYMYVNSFIKTNLLKLFKKNIPKGDLEIVKNKISVVLQCIDMNKDYYSAYYYPELKKDKKVNRQSSVEAAIRFRKEFNISEKEINENVLIDTLEENDNDIFQTFQQFYGK